MKLCIRAINTAEPVEPAKGIWVPFTTPTRVSSLSVEDGRPCLVGRNVGQGNRAWVWIDELAGAQDLELAVDSTDPVEPQPIAGGLQPPLSVYVRAPVEINTMIPWTVTSAYRLADDIIVTYARGQVQGWVAEAWCEIFPRAGYSDFSIKVTWSTDQIPQTTTSLDEIALVASPGAKIRMLYPNLALPRQQIEWIPGQGYVADTQGQIYSGRVYVDPKHEALYVGAIEGADWNGWWGPYGIIGQASTKLTTHVNSAISRWLSLAKQPTSFDWAESGQYGLAANSGTTGAQNDFGATKMLPALHGYPEWIPAAHRSACFEAKRPGDFRDGGGAPQNPWEHPRHVTWSNYTHWHTGVSKDRLGKEGENPKFGGGWIGPDRQHWSNNYLCGAYLLTGDRALLACIEKQARAILSGETIVAGWSTSNAGASRGIGRTLEAAGWIDRCLDPGSHLQLALRERIKQRLEQVIEPQTRDYAGFLGRVRDARVLGGVEAVRPWEDALGIMGLWVGWTYFGVEAAKDVLDRCVPAWLDHGWYHIADRWYMADAVSLEAIRGGYVAYPEPPAKATPTAERREGFEEWSYGSLRIAAVLGHAPAAQIYANVFPKDPDVEDCEWAATA